MEPSDSHWFTQRKTELLSNCLQRAIRGRTCVNSEIIVWIRSRLRLISQVKGWGFHFTRWKLQYVCESCMGGRGNGGLKDAGGGAWWWLITNKADKRRHKRSGSQPGGPQPPTPRLEGQAGHKGRSSLRAWQQAELHVMLINATLLLLLTANNNNNNTTASSRLSEALHTATRPDGRHSLESQTFHTF